MTLSLISLFMKILSDISVQYLKGVGPARKKLFANLGVENIEDLLYLFPRRYEDRTNMTRIAEVKLGEWQSVTGKVIANAARKSWYTRKHVYEIAIDDGSGRMACVWFNQPYLENYFKPDARAIFYGKVEIYKNRLQMIAPEYEIIESEEEDSLSVGRIVPVYPLTRGMSQRYLRKIIRVCLDKYLPDVADVLPVPLRNKYRLANLKRSLENIHFPESFSQQEAALRRISFEEFFFFQVSVILRRMSITHKPGIAHKIEGDLISKFSSAFPFKLTNAQKKVMGEISEGLRQSNPMLRLLQGDVGSGKTIVALWGALVAQQNHFQSAIMAPTEILARQHFENIKKFLGIEDSRIKGIQKDTDPKFLKSFNPRICLLTSNIPQKEHENILADIKDGKVDIIVGTHALLSENVEFKNLSFVVIDEQHKFGVRQRALLSKKGQNPHILIMTATPIPRTLCMTLYGDLDVSILDELPPGRGKITTKFFSEEQAPEVYSLIRENLKSGRQAYVIYPIIEESEKSDLKAAQTMFRHFEQEFKEFKIGLVHGQMKRKDSETAMKKFKAKEINMLVATTVLEVGVDVPNANVMVVEHAERFGLSQLHQLRGRVGRGEDDALCLLIGNQDTAEGKARIEAIVSTSDGFKIAEKDLMIRGPGRYFGRHQHGLNELKFADPIKQIDILELARQEAQDVVEQDPHLKKDQNHIIREVIQKRYPTYLAMVEAG